MRNYFRAPRLKLYGEIVGKPVKLAAVVLRHVLHTRGKVCITILQYFSEIQRHSFSSSFVMSILGLTRQRLTALSNPECETEEDQQSSHAATTVTRPSNNGSFTQQSEPQHVLPTLSHRMKTDSSILALALSDEALYAGTQNGEILVFSLDSYERIAVIEAHKGSVLDLCISPEEGLLFSSAADRITNVWDCLLYTSPSPRDGLLSRMPSSA